MPCLQLPRRVYLEQGVKRLLHQISEPNPHLTVSSLFPFHQVGMKNPNSLWEEYLYDIY